MRNDMTRAIDPRERLAAFNGNSATVTNTATDNQRLAQAAMFIARAHGKRTV